MFGKYPSFLLEQVRKCHPVSLEALSERISFISGLMACVNQPADFARARWLNAFELTNHPADAVNAISVTPAPHKRCENLNAPHEPLEIGKPLDLLLIADLKLHLVALRLTTKD